jgi:hypothetical protein
MPDRLDGQRIGLPKPASFLTGALNFNLMAATARPININCGYANAVVDQWGIFMSSTSRQLRISSGAARIRDGALPSRRMAANVT